MSTMGVSTDIMHDFVAQEVKRLYSSYDGWTITSRSENPDYDTIFQLDRLNEGHREIARILATYKKELTPGLVDELKRSGRTPDGMIPRYQFAVMVPAHADTSAVPADISVYTMQSFSFDGDALTWVKKPVRKTDTTLQKQAVRQAA